MHGLILETNINRGDDGGLYAELVYNRAFQEMGRSLDGWITYGEGSIGLSNIQPLSNALPVQMKFTLTETSASPSGFQNGGFYGMNTQAQSYTATFYYRPSANAHVGGGKLTIGLGDAAGLDVFGTSTVDVSNAPANVWSNFSASISVYLAAPSTQNVFFIEFPPNSKGNFEFNLISCFPPTFKNRTNGVRIDIAQRFIWNNTIGPLKNRPGRQGSWV
ncbi:unnamed protein product [Adineta ricciae]|nr:unnamed protein product [Adineta ricciae]